MIRKGMINYKQGVTMIYDVCNDYSLDKREDLTGVSCFQYGGFKKDVTLNFKINDLWESIPCTLYYNSYRELIYLSTDSTHDLDKHQI